jgi:hypothetical protein
VYVAFERLSRKETRWRNQRQVRNITKDPHRLPDVHAYSCDHLRPKSPGLPFRRARNLVELQLRLSFPWPAVELED